MLRNPEKHVVCLHFCCGKDTLVSSANGTTLSSNMQAPRQTRGGAPLAGARWNYPLREPSKTGLPEDQLASSAGSSLRIFQTITVATETQPPTSQGRLSSLPLARKPTSPSVVSAYDELSLADAP